MHRKVNPYSLVGMWTSADIMKNGKNKMEKTRKRNKQLFC